MTRVVALVSDLFFRTKIEGAAAQAGLDVDFAAPEGANLVLIDLDAFGVAAVSQARTSSPGARIVGFCAHANTDLLAQARQAGCEAMPRSLFFKRLPDILRA